MHYKNGREAKVGDSIIAKQYNGTAFAGVVVQANPGSTTCNLQVAPVQNVHTFTASECMHIDDAMEFVPPASTSPEE